MPTGVAVCGRVATGTLAPFSVRGMLGVSVVDEAEARAARVEARESFPATGVISAVALPNALSCVVVGETAFDLDSALIGVDVPTDSSGLRSDMGS